MHENPANTNKEPAILTRLALFIFPPVDGDTRHTQPTNLGTQLMPRHDANAHEEQVRGAGGFAVGELVSKPVQLAAQTGVAASMKVPLDLAEWSYFWVGVERAELASGTYVNGKQMYVESWIPARVRHPYPIVLVHGGGGQGLDWMVTPDGRPGWATYLAQEGYRVYVVDRPGHGHAPLHPMLHGAFPAQAGTPQNHLGRFSPPNPTPTAKPLSLHTFHNS